MDYPPIAPGASLQGTTTAQLAASINTNRNCTIEITNNLNAPLTDPQSYCNSGNCYTPLQPKIEPFTREAFSFSKASEAVRGSVGVFTYRVEGTGQRLAVMFSVPYDYTLSSNWFAVGFVEDEVEANDALYQDMYYGEEWKDRNDRKREKASHARTLHVENNQGIKVDATMSDAKRAIIKIDVSSSYGQNYGENCGQPQYPPQHHHHHHHDQQPNW